MKENLVTTSAHSRKYVWSNREGLSRTKYTLQGRGQGIQDISLSKTSVHLARSSQLEFSSKDLEFGLLDLNYDKNLWNYIPKDVLLAWSR